MCYSSQLVLLPDRLGQPGGLQKCPIPRLLKKTLMIFLLKQTKLRNIIIALCEAETLTETVQKQSNF